MMSDGKILAPEPAKVNINKDAIDFDKEPEFSVFENVSTCAAFVFTLPLCLFNWVTVRDYQRAVMLRHGKRAHKGTMAGGLHYVIPSIDQILKLDVRESIIDIPRQSVVTREGTNLNVDGVVYYRVFDAQRAFFAVKSVNISIANLAQTKLREILALHTYNQIQLERIKLAKALKAILDTETEEWGVDITRVELTELKLPPKVQMAMNSETEEKRRAIAAKVAANSRAEVALVDAHGKSRAQLVTAEGNAQAKLVYAEAVASSRRIEADGEKSAAIDFKEAASVYASQPTTLQLRYLQTLESIGEGAMNKTIIPVNTDTLSMNSI